MGRKTTFKVGSRKSQLALIQTNTIIDKLKSLNPDLSFEIITMATTGDKILDSALSKIGEKNLFTRELELALERKEVDFVVHSLKDLPTLLPEGLLVGCVYKRDSPYDAVVMHPKHKGKKLEDLPENSVIGTSSLRRGAQLKKKFPNFTFENIRGNLNTRFKKLDDDDKYDAIILAVAGLERMGWSDRISEILAKDICMYAVSQGAMGVECRDHDYETQDLLAQIHDPETVIACVAERSFLKKLEGGCSVPVCAYTEIKDGTLSLTGGVYSIDGTKSKVETVTAKIPKLDEPPTKKPARQNGPKQYAAIIGSDEISPDALQIAESVGIKLAEIMLNSEAGEILKEAKKQTAAAVIEEKERKEKERQEKEKQQQQQ